MAHPYIEIEDPASHVGKLCHVRGWRPGAVFRLVETTGSWHTLETPKSRNRHELNGVLLYTRSNEPEPRNADA